MILMSKALGSGSRAATRRALNLVPLLAAPAVYAAALVMRPGPGFHLVIDGLLLLFAVWVPAAACWVAAARSDSGRLPGALAALGITSWAAGATYFVVRTAAGESVPLPSPADVGYLCFPLFMLASLAVIVRRRFRRLAWPVAVDSAVGGLGAAAVLAVALNPILDSAVGPRTSATVIAAAYPLLDFLTAAAAVGIGVAAARSNGFSWMLLATGLTVFAVADIAFALVKVGGLYSVGTPLDATWPVGLALVSAWVVTEGTSSSTSAAKAVPPLSQAVPTLAIAAGLTVLIVGTQVRVPLLAVVLAGLTLAMSALPLVFRQRIRMAVMQKQARTDELTNLLNRRAFYSDVPQRLLDKRAEESSILLLDLDNFKEINDSLGHQVGDDLLRRVARRLCNALRPEDLLARMGGDEFVAHLSACGRDGSEVIAEKLRDALKDPFVLGSTTVHVSASVGIALYPEQATELPLLLRKADLAMYAAKSSHSGHRVYQDADDSSSLRQVLTLKALNDALARDELLLHFQPKVNLGTGKVRGVEALVRWKHPTLGLLLPDAFLGRFEEAGLMPSLTTAVLVKALDQVAAWRNNGWNLSVAVNIPAPSIVDSGLPGRVGSLATERGLPPSVLVLEITEDLLLGDRNRARSVLMSLRAMGVRVAVDDYGKGYSSLAYLRELPVDELKLDKSFVLAMDDDDRATALVVSTINLAHSLGLEMTAEGVESEAAYRALGEYGCDAAQGFYVSKPLPAAELEPWLRSKEALHPLPTPLP